MKNIKNKSILSIVSALLMPLGLVVSCGGSSNNEQVKKKEKTFNLPDISQAKTLNFEKVDLKFFKEEAIKIGITKDQIDSITIDDVHRYRTEDDLIVEKKNIIKKLDQLLIKLAFDNVKNPEVMKALQVWINNAALPVFSSQRDGRGPWRTDASQGDIKYYRHDFLQLRSTIDGKDFLGSNFKKDSGYNEDRSIHGFNSLSKPKKGHRLFDTNILTGNTMTGGRKSARSFSIFRTRSTGKYEYDVNPKTGVKNWTSEEKEVTKLFGGLNIEINNESPKDRSYESIKELAIKMPKDSIISFNNSKTRVNYGVARNNKAIDSGVKFNAKDLFYGLLRSFYSSEKFRKEGILENWNLNKFIRKFNNDQNIKWNNLFKDEKSAKAFNNSNTYLFELFGIDLEETIKLNLNYQEEDKFFVKFNSFTPTSLGMFTDSTILNPVPKSVIKDPLIDGEGNKYFDADTLSVFNYGNPYKGKGKIDPEGIYLLSPFIYTSYSVSERELIRLLQNPAYYDKEWVNNETSIKSLVIENKVEGIDASAYAQARLQAFQDAKNTGEYILDGDLYNKKTLLAKLRKYIVYTKPLRSGTSDTSIFSWNFYGFKDPSFNDLGKKMMWGFKSDDDIKNNEESMQTFFSGNGAKTRAAIKAAINWYSMAQTLFPGQNKEFYPAIALDDDFKVSKVNISKANPNYLSTNEDMKNIYQANLKQKYKAWTPRTVKDAAKTLDELANIVGATKDKPAQIGFFRYVFLKLKPTEQVIETNKMILKRLNTLTPKVQFTNFKQYSWSDFVKNSYYNPTYPVYFGGFNPDYKGLASINQQFLSKYSSFGLVSFFKDAFDQDQ